MKYISDTVATESVGIYCTLNSKQLIATAGKKSRGIFSKRTVCHVTFRCRPTQQTHRSINHFLASGQQYTLSKKQPPSLPGKRLNIVRS